MRDGIDERPEGPEALAGLARQLIDEFGAVGAKLRGYADVDEVLADLSTTCQRLLPHADHASTSRRERQGFVTIGATSDVPPRVDRIQYELGHGPCVDAILTENLFNAGDLRIDPRWPEFGRRAAEETGILSMLSFRLFFEDADSADLMAALNLYAAKPQAFDEVDETILGLVATHGAFAITAAQQRRRADGVTAALQTNRDIGAALGVLMARLLVTREQAFDLMRIASQRSNRKMREIAEDVLETGILSMLSFRLFFEDTGSADLLAGLNLYAAKPEAFDEVDETIIGLVATHGALAISAAQQRRRADGLTAALQSNRDIGAALGVLMTRLLVTREQAFDLMRIASQRTNRKLRDIAQDVLETGTLAFLEQPQRPGRPDQPRGGD